MQSKPKCSVQVCDREAVCKGLCLQHYARMKRNGHPGTTPIKAVAKKGHRVQCSQCAKGAMARGLCPAHYRQWRHSRTDSDRCLIVDCTRAAVSRAMCEMHYARWARVGEAAENRRRRGAPARGKTVGYAAAHHRVRGVFGAAVMHDCLACHEPADDWAYDHSDPGQVFSESNNCWYSTDPTHYIPLCKKCHNAFDAQEGMTWDEYTKSAASIS